MLRLVPLVAVVALAASGCTISRKKESVSDDDKVAALDSVKARINDPHALMTEWYRKSLKPVVEVSSTEKSEGILLTTKTTVETVSGKLDLHLMWSSVYLGLLVFPVVGLFFFCVEALANTGGMRAEFEQANDRGEGLQFFGVFLLVVVAVPYVLALFLAGVVAVGSVALCPLLVGPETYVPFHYAYFLCQSLVILAVVLFAVFVYLVAPLLGFLWPARASASTTQSQAREERTRRLLRAAVKAIIVAVLTTLGNQLGGWIGGMIALVVAGVLAAFADPPPAS